jgi:hypothetical protein
MSQAVVSVREDIAFLYECFSEAPLRPRRFDFSDHLPRIISWKQKRRRSHQKMIEVLAKVFLIMFEKKARMELKMQFAKAKVNMLNGNGSG